MQIRVELSDVYEQGTLTDYAGELRARTSLRITDKLNTPHPGWTGRGDGVGRHARRHGSVHRHRRHDRGRELQPGHDLRRARARHRDRDQALDLGAGSQLQLDDGGADNDAETPGDNTLFMTQGIFIP